jgi:hypothetical protein
MFLIQVEEPAWDMVALLVNQYNGSIYATRFNTLNPCSLPTQCIYVFHVILTVNSDCFPKLIYLCNREVMCFL